MELFLSFQPLPRPRPVAEYDEPHCWLLLSDPWRWLQSSEPWFQVPLWLLVLDFQLVALQASLPRQELDFSFP